MIKSNAYTSEQLQWIVDNQASITRQQLADRFKATYGVTVSSNALSKLCNRNNLLSSTPAWNKGMPPTGNSFKKGHKVRAKPVGYEYLRSDGSIWVKVAEPKTYKRKQYIVWDQHQGIRPKNHDIRFLDNDKTNCAIDNLICVPKGIAININLHNPANTDHPELNRAIYLNETLKQKIRNNANG